MNSVRIVLCAALLAALPAHANQTSGPAIDPRLVERGWTLFERSEWKPARFEAAENNAIRVTTNNSTALIWRRLGDAVKQRRHLSWRWRVDRSDIEPVDLGQKERADRPIALHVGFEQDSSTSDFMRSLAARMMGAPPPGRVITYTWGGTQKAGEVLVSPYLGDEGRIVILRAGNAPLRDWVSESVDLKADFRRYFGYAPPPVAYIAISADADDQPGHTLARIADIRFQGAE